MATEYDFEELVDQHFALREEHRRLRERAKAMCHAYAAEVSANSTGVEIVGFPLLDAYQELFKELYPPDEPGVA